MRILLGWGCSSNEAGPAVGTLLGWGFSWDEGIPGWGQGGGSCPPSQGLRKSREFRAGSREGCSGRIREDPGLRHRE